MVNVIQAVIAGLALSAEQVHQARVIATEALRKALADDPDWSGWPW
jgi:hypothetical protein